MKVHETCRDKRKELKIKQCDLAVKIGVRQATISDFENGKHGLSSDILDRILEALDIKLT